MEILNLDHAPVISRRPLILIVDDEALIRLALAGALEDNGFLTAQSENGAEALVEAKAMSPDIVVTDIQMPGSDGLELIRSLRHVGLSMPIIAMSGGSSHRDTLMVARNLGANATLAKPFDADALVRLVADLLPGRTG